MMILNNDIYHLKAVCLIDGKNKPYRLVAIEKYKNLTELAEAILGSFDFECDHCFGFYDNIKNWLKSTVAYERFVDVDVYTITENVKSPNKSTIESVFYLGKPMLFLFDYGDEWHFKVELIGSHEVEKNKVYPFVLEKQGEAPKQYG